MEGRGRWLAGKVFLVSGAASGIGRAVATKCTAAGAAVVALDLNDEVEAVARAIRAAGGACVAVVGDVTAEADCARAVDVALGPWSGLDGTANCAGVAPRAPIGSISLSEWDRALAVNLTGSFLIARETIRALRLHRRGGSLVLVSSVAGLVGMPNLAGYAAAKGGVVSLARELAVELASEGIRANVVCPGATDTPAFWSRADVRADPTIADRAREGYPLLRFHQRLIDPGEIADAILFLLSDDARMVTGAVLPVDAGYLAR